MINGKQKVEIRSPNTTQHFFSAWGTMKHGVSLGSILWPLLFIIYINYLLLIINCTSEPILFADNTNVIISSRNFKDFYSVSNLDISHIIKWFAANKLVLNLDEMNIMELITKNSSHSTLCIGYKERYIEEVVNTKFLGLQFYNNLNGKNRIEQMISKWSMLYCWVARPYQ